MSQTPPVAVGVPTHPGDITPEWIGGALGVPVDDVVVERIAEDVGMLTILCRVRLQTDDLTAPSSVVVKLPSSEPLAQGLNQGFRFWERECAFYSKYAEQTPMRTPKCHFVAFDESRAEGVVVLEDLGDATIADQLGGFSLEQARAVIVELAGLHAAFWNRTDDPSFADVPRADDDRYRQFFTHGLAAAWPNCRARLGDEVPSGTIETGDRLAQHGGAVMALVAHEPRTLVHFEPRGDNLLFVGEADAPQVVVLDWQGFFRACGAWDFAWFIIQSLDVDDRRAHEAELMQLYVDELVRAGVTGYGLADLKRDYRQFSLCAFIGAVMASLDARDDDRLVRIRESMLLRAASAVDDFGATDLLSAAGV
jgi:hypothetical protein